MDLIRIKTNTIFHLKIEIKHQNHSCNQQNFIVKLLVFEPLM